MPVWTRGENIEAMRLHPAWTVDIHTSEACLNTRITCVGAVGPSVGGCVGLSVGGCVGTRVGAYGARRALEGHWVRLEFKSGQMNKHINLTFVGAPVGVTVGTGSLMEVMDGYTVVPSFETKASA